ncbi:hypothetical protein B0H13DRAFT_2371258 [Mycena leptocephala]|nr:hypothetical protein B0H13DRAFT_2371258 [Mycena leptocephala]
MSSIARSTRALDEHNRLSLSYTYAPNNLIRAAFEWVKHKSGKILRERRLTTVVDHTTPLEQAAFITMVGKLSEHNAQLTTVGNFKPQFNNTAVKAKFIVQLDCPIHDPILAAAWDAGLSNLRHIEQMVCEGSSNFFVDDKDTGSVSVRLSKPLFEAKGKPQEVDPAQWLIPADCRQAFTSALQGHDLRPMRAFDLSDQPIAPQHMQQALPGALVAVTWMMIYYNIRKDDTFVPSLTGEITQVLVLEPPRPKPANVFSSARPYRPGPTSVGPFAQSHYHSPAPVTGAPLPQVPYQPMAQAAQPALSRRPSHDQSLAGLSHRPGPQPEVLSTAHAQLQTDGGGIPHSQNGLFGSTAVTPFLQQSHPATSVSRSPGTHQLYTPQHTNADPPESLRTGPSHTPASAFFQHDTPRAPTPSAKNGGHAGQGSPGITPTWNTPPSPVGLVGSAIAHASHPALSPASHSPYQGAFAGGHAARPVSGESSVPMSLLLNARSNSDVPTPAFGSPRGTPPPIPLTTRPLSRATSTPNSRRSADPSMAPPTVRGVSSHLEAGDALLAAPTAAPVDPSPFYGANPIAPMDETSKSAAGRLPTTPPNRTAVIMPNTPGRERPPSYATPFRSAASPVQVPIHSQGSVVSGGHLPPAASTPSVHQRPITRMLNPTVVQRIPTPVPSDTAVNGQLLPAFNMAQRNPFAGAGTGSWTHPLMNLNDTRAPTPNQTHEGVFGMQPGVVDDGYSTDIAAFSPLSSTPLWLGVYGDIAQSFAIGANDGPSLEEGTSNDGTDRGLVASVDTTSNESTESDSSASSTTGDSGSWDTTGSSDDTDEHLLDRYKHIMEVKRGKRKADFQDDGEMHPKRRLYRVNWAVAEGEDDADEDIEAEHEEQFSH